LSLVFNKNWISHFATEGGDYCGSKEKDNKEKSSKKEEIVE